MSEELNKTEEIPEAPNEARWYVVHTYSGYENKVKANIEKIIENRGMQDQIYEVVVPMEEAVEIKNGQKKMVKRKEYPGYVLLKMFMNDDTWYVVRNTRGVTSFVGPGSKPVPLSDSEVEAMGIESVVESIDVEIGDAVTVSKGPMAGSIGIIKEIKMDKKTVVVKLSIFGRETPTELKFDQIEKV
ncbi:MAG: transcription termination/antitermination protein NusG [Clostridiales bacterium]|nr:transcription termination/antitermination protein NusG [Clostridiales bacterium]